MSLAPVKKRTVSCPACGKATPFTPDNPFRPFCSQRCKLIDLGQWANEEYRVPDSDMRLNEDAENQNA